MAADWRIQFWTPCTRYVFLSHCQEDRKRLVLPVFHELSRLQCTAWIDQHHYPAGRDAFETLRDKILECRHVIYFVTPSYLNQGRGWTGIERAYATLVQQNLRYGPNDVCHVELPLYFVPRDHRAFARSAWGGQVGVSRGEWYHPRRIDHRAIDWAVQTIVDFIRQEELHALDIGDRVSRDRRMKKWLDEDPHLRNRVLAISPPPLPTGII